MAGLIVRVMITDEAGGRRPVQAELVSRNKKSIWVKLPNGRTIKRNIERDLKGWGK